MYADVSADKVYEFIAEKKEHGYHGERDDKEQCRENRRHPVPNIAGGFVRAVDRLYPLTYRRYSA